MADFDTWATVLQMEAALRNRAAARRAELGPLPARRRRGKALARAVARLLRVLLRRPARALPAEAALPERGQRPACHGRTLAARRPCRVCGARGHGAAAFRLGYRPRRCSRRIARGKSRI